MDIPAGTTASHLMRYGFQGGETKLVP
ncbi:MAG: hypothetical protein CL912_27825 [Deltaproteobacteria bacterium]|nr:hypothetical protein [Deltaproteobacteria bacterium]